MSAFAANGSITTDWPSEIKSTFLYEGNNQGAVMNQAIPINITLTGDFPIGFPVGVNIDILGPTDNTVLTDMNFPTPSRPRDTLAVYPPYCQRKNTKCLLNYNGDARVSAVTSDVFSNATAQTFLFYIFLPTLFPGWFDVNYRATFSFLDSYVLPDGTTVTNTFSGNVTWPEPFNFTVRKRDWSEVCDVVNVNGNNVVTPYDANNQAECAPWFDPAETVNANGAPSINTLSIRLPRDTIHSHASTSPSVFTGSLSGPPYGSTDPLNATVVNVVSQTLGSFPRYPFTERLKVIFEITPTASYLVAYSINGSNFRFIQGGAFIETVSQGNAWIAREPWGQPGGTFSNSSGTYSASGSNIFVQDIVSSSIPSDWVELPRGTITNLTVRLWSTAGNVSTTRYFALNYTFPDADPSLDLFNLNNFQAGRPDFAITSNTPAFSIPPSSNAPLVLSVGKRVNNTDAVYNVTASLYLSAADPNAITGTFQGIATVTNGVAWVNIPVTTPIYPLANGAFKIVVNSFAQSAINYMRNGGTRNVTAYRTTYTFNVYNGTTNSILAELNAGDGGRLTFNPYSTTQQATFKPVAVNGVPTFPTILWTIGYANSFFNSAFGPQHPIFTLNGANTIVTVDSNQILPYTTYPLGQNLMTMQVRETNYTILLNITSSVSSINFQVSYDGTNFFPVANVPAFDVTTLTTTPVAVNQSAVAFRVVATFDSNVISVGYSYPLNNANQTGTISNSGSNTTLFLPGQGSSYILTLTAGGEGSYTYNVSQAPYRTFDRFTNITSSVGSLSPAFDASLTTYNLTVPYGTGNINLNAWIDPSSTANANVRLTNVNNNSDSTTVSAYTFSYANGQAVLSGLNASLATDAYPLYVILNSLAEDPNRPAVSFQIIIRVAPRPISTDSTLSALTSYPTNISYVPSTTAYNVTLPYPETLFQVSGATNDRVYARGVQVVAELYNNTASAVVSLISNTSLTLTAGAWQSANISAATANSAGLVVRVTVQVTAEDGASSNYVLNVQLGTAPAVSSSSSSSSTGGSGGGSNSTSSSTGTGGGSNSTSSSSTGTGGGSNSTSSSTGTGGGSNSTSSSSGTGGGSNSTSSSSGTGGGSNSTSSSSGTTSGSTGTTGTTSGSTGTTSGSTGTTSGSTGTNGGSSGSNSNSTSSSSTGTCVPGQAGCNSGFARAAVGAASPLAILMAFMAILLLA